MRFASRGFSLHAATRVEATDRVQLEKLCRYVIRPPLAAGRLQILDAEHVAFSLQSIGSDGTYQIVLSPEELLEKLAALVPPPRLNLVRYHGVLAPNASGRAQAAARGSLHPRSDGIDWPGQSCWRECSNSR